MFVSYLCILFTCYCLKHPIGHFYESMCSVEIFSEEASQIVRILSRDMVEIETVANAVYQCAQYGSYGHILVE